MAEKYLFPNINPSYCMNKNLRSNFFWLPRPNFNENNNPDEKFSHIPALLVKASINSKILIIYCHVNGVDIGQLDEELQIWSNLLDAHILAHEYPGYGAINEEKRSANGCKQSTHTAYSFVINELKWPANNIIIFGRSIGSGPATDLANDLCTNIMYTKPAMLILQSAYLSIKDMASHVISNISFVGHLLSQIIPSFITEKFDNKKQIQQINCPIYFIHGELDELIPKEHSLKLYELAVMSTEKDIYIDNHSDHNVWDIYNVIAEINIFYDNIVKNLPDVDINIRNKIIGLNNKINYNTVNYRDQKHDKNFIAKISSHKEN